MRSLALICVAALACLPGCVEDNPFFMETDAPTSTGFVFPTTADPTEDTSSTTGGESVTTETPTTEAPTTDAPTTDATATDGTTSGESGPTETATETATMTDTDAPTSSTGGAGEGSSSSSTGAAT